MEATWFRERWVGRGAGETTLMRDPGVARDQGAGKAQLPRDPRARAGAFITHQHLAAVCAPILIATELPAVEGLGHRRHHHGAAGRCHERVSGSTAWKR